MKRSSNVSQDNMEDFVTKAFNYYENADANTSSIGHIEQCLQLIYANDRDELINNVNFANAKQKCLILRNKILEMPLNGKLKKMENPKDKQND